MITGFLVVYGEWLFSTKNNTLLIIRVVRSNDNYSMKPMMKTAVSATTPQHQKPPLTIANWPEC